jgi:hypothetical protein
VRKKVIYFVIPNEVRNLSFVETQEKRDSSARSAPRNDKNFRFSMACEACAASDQNGISSSVTSGPDCSRSVGAEGPASKSAEPAAAEFVR